MSSGFSFSHPPARWPQLLNRNASFLGSSLRVSLWSVAAMLSFALAVGCSPGQGGAGGTAADTTSTAAEAVSGGADDKNAEDDWFVDRAAELGLEFVHFNGASGDFFYPEILPPGVGLFDYDNDGDLDVFVVQGQMLGTGTTVTNALIPPVDSSALGGRLYRNDLRIDADGAQTLRFTDVTDESGITADGYGLGVVAGDIDNDGWIDLVVTNFGPAQLFRNNRDGTFTDVSSGAGIEAREGFGVSAAFVDYDRDGWLDLYVGNNVDYGLDNDTECPNMAGSRDYCPPQTYGGLQDSLYRNRVTGRLTMSARRPCNILSRLVSRDPRADG